jgi:UDP-N-acetylmuramyl pentapeptide phosphotransferase/UDP-N-acetylglucosamine-1-phosphate transferase
MNPTTGLKWSAVFFTVFWTAGMLLWNGSYHPANILFTALAGLIAGYLWYRIMCWIIIGRKRFPR